MPKGSCRIILVRPRDPNNIGAAARAMKNFGMTDLYVVAPHPPIWDEVVSAVNAEDVIRNARVVYSLSEAVADCNFVVGTADRSRVETKQPLYTPGDLNRELEGGDYRLALVFGSEKLGLTNEDLSHCLRVMSIPTQPNCPSINLGQAVAICCYELADAPATSSLTPKAAEPAPAADIETALQLALDVLRSAEFVLPGHENELTLKLRRSLVRFQLTDREAKTLLGALQNIKRKIQ